MNGDQDKAAPALPPDAQSRIGARLRQMYDSMVKEPVPDRFAALLQQLESSAAPANSGPEQTVPGVGGASPSSSSR